MSDQLQEQMRCDVHSLGWRSQEIKINGQWRITLTRGETSVVATGEDYSLTRNTAYGEALRASTGAATE